MEEQPSSEARRASPSVCKEAKEQKAVDGLFSSKTTDTSAIMEWLIQVLHSTHSAQVLSTVQHTHDNNHESHRTSYSSTAILVCLCY